MNIQLQDVSFDNIFRGPINEGNVILLHDKIWIRNSELQEALNNWSKKRCVNYRFGAVISQHVHTRALLNEFYKIALQLNAIFSVPN